MNIRFGIFAAIMVAVSLEAATKNLAPIISSNDDGRLIYDLDERGNKVPDFSHAGYGGGGVPIPDVAIKVVVEAKPGDNTERIQNAIDYVSDLPEDARGIRGAILLSAGRHEVLGGIHIRSSGVILRGQGMEKGGTVLVATGQDRRTLIRIAGENNPMTESNAGWRIAANYVPVGSTEFSLSSTEGLNVGDQIHVVRPSTMEWIETLGAREFGGGEGDWRLAWKPGSRDISWDRTINSIRDNRIVVDAPVTAAIDTQFGGGFVERYDWPGRIHQVGIENIRLESTFDPDNAKDESHAWFAVTLENVEDAWIRQVTAQHFVGSMVAVYETARRTTVQDCISIDPVSEIGGYRRHTFFTMGQQTLFLRCHAENGRHDFSVGLCAAGPNAFVQCEAVGALGDSGSIESWASGILYDNVNIDGHGLTLGFRGHSPHGAGWAAANSVFWQCAAAFIQCENPPTAQNWAFGSWAEFIGDGHWRGSNEFVSPDSLYAAQLRDRLGNEAMENLQILQKRRGGFTNPPIELAQELAALAHRPAPLLIDYIKGAAKRDPIPTEPESAVSVDELPRPAMLADSNPQSARLQLKNGWLTIGGKLLTGGKTGVTWWRGNIRPKDAASVGVGLTRFVPGRSGAGFTDNFDELADWMIANGQSVLDHNYGLWYDRRRDDHQRVRRMNGDVWPPFYEQPFARSGKGTGWDGLSRYDLTQFNPWYWERLRAFAETSDQQGLVLFHQNYFQHNILEAAAHWADFPWRPVNNVNETEFSEPPPYAGDKRIFMAELFYDVDHPARRELHRGYIRQCLENFRTNSNVVQFIGAEFTGPQHFMNFWLDTIAEWQQERRNINADPLIALSSTKDVQDAVLADPTRAPVIDIIDFRYWWRTSEGEFAPLGGMNLAPRQFQRRWRGGQPKDADLAQMATLYRERFPAKALVCDFENASWAWLCAGGSQPRLPSTTDARLLEAVPQMRPLIRSNEQGVRILHEPGRQYLVYNSESRSFELDLSNAPGTFQVTMIDQKTGAASSRGSVNGGSKVVFSVPLVWLRKTL